MTHGVREAAGRRLVHHHATVVEGRHVTELAVEVLVEVVPTAGIVAVSSDRV
jgi:hypothetical protein